MRTALMLLAFAAPLAGCSGSGSVPSAQSAFAKTIRPDYEACGEHGFSWERQPDRAHYFSCLVVVAHVLSLRLQFRHQTVHRVIPDRAGHPSQARELQH
jgi:hypothetical protein